MTRARLIEAGGGGILIAFGLAFAIGAFRYRIGDFLEMGPGMFPLIVGLAITFMGAVVLLLGVVGGNEDPEPFDAAVFKRRMRVLGLVSSSLLVFGLLIRSFGMFPAIMALVLLVGLTERERRPVVSVLTAIVLAVLAWLIFAKGLGLNIPAVRWGL
ncbi:tripartite tricarboxylate transporter TctB family protein [Pararhizobium haloflavum]|uniref:tripartite tricarboxylate transporter TctB family protein n=1 Tax=Pararhizobium haloflavum TaxID=2037914 RepID=UPI0012FFD7C0|nr:tripartite tricarboxylate transporter TctB family protein [Pararhizobium haloflavum]